MMKEKGAFEKNCNIVQALELYFMFCSIEVNAEQTASIAATLANAGVCPLSEELVFQPRTVRNSLSMMASCGMYDFSGEFAFKMGFPAKSGVSGSLMIVIPGLMVILFLLFFLSLANTNKEKERKN
jgi:glutaminase